MPSSNSQHFQVTLQAAPTKAPALLSKLSGLPITTVKQAMKQGSVWLTRANQTRRLRRHGKTLQNADVLDWYYNPAVMAETTADPQLIADHGSYSVWYKPPGMRSHGSRWGDHCSLYRWVETHSEPSRPALLVHRLDRAASGLMLLAHSKAMAAQLSQLFREQAIDKRYRAVLTGLWELDDQAHKVDTPLDDKTAISHFKLLEQRPKTQQSLLQIGIETGRKHQIRRHAADIGYPVVGDRLYNVNNTTPTEDLALVCVQLDFQCPVQKKPVSYTLPESLLPQTCQLGPAN